VPTHPIHVAPRPLTEEELNDLADVLEYHAIATARWSRARSSMAEQTRVAREARRIREMAAEIRKLTPNRYPPSKTGTRNPADVAARKKIGR
jgi:hypothetical protein